MMPPPLRPSSLLRFTVCHRPAALFLCTLLLATACRKPDLSAAAAAEAIAGPLVVQAEPEAAAALPEIPEPETGKASPPFLSAAAARPAAPPARSLSELSGKLPRFGVNITEVNPVNYENADPAVLRQMGVEPYLILFVSAGQKYRAGDWDGAVGDYSQALKHKGDFTEALEGRGSAWLKKGESKRAVEDFSRAISYRNDRAEVYNYRGYAYASLGNTEQALADYTRALKLKPDYADALANRAYSLYGQGDYDKAIEDCSRLLRLEPGNAAIWNRRGSAWYGKADDDRAIADFTEAINLNPRYVLAFHNRGSAWYNKGDTDKALADLNKAISIDPSFSTALTSRAAILAELGRPQNTAP